MVNLVMIADPTHTERSTLEQAEPNARIESLDVLRGFALLGILLLNIIGFGLPAAAYFNPEIGLGSSVASERFNLAVWAGVDLLFEGALRGLFSLLFGAGVVLFTTGAAASVWPRFRRRNLWLLVFGLFDAAVLLWTGDILLCYGLAAFLLYPLRQVSPQRLLALAAALFVLLTLQNAAFAVGLDSLRSLADSVPSSERSAEEQELVAGWLDFQSEHAPSASAQEAERAARAESYGSAWRWTVAQLPDLYGFQLPVIMLWDALAMMVLGMALQRFGVLDGRLAPAWYASLAVAGFATGLVINLWELERVFTSGFDVLVTHSFMRWSYHAGRLAMTLGYLGLILLFCSRGWWAGVRSRLAAVGRMALSNYLAHSLIALVIFSGAGFGLVGRFERWELYLVVLVIWILQLLISPWWLRRFRFGPVEWLWRSLTYGQRQPFRSAHSPNG
ncbi:MAG: DUF418 domain-containing protein [Pseudomonadota bacterium]